MIALSILTNMFISASDIKEWQMNIGSNASTYGVSEVTELDDEIIFYADLPANVEQTKILIKTNYRRFEFGMMYDFEDNKLENYGGSFLVRLIKSDETEFSFIAKLGLDAVYLNGDDYEAFYFPESFYGEHVKVIVKILKNDFPSYIDKVFFYLGSPRSK